MPIDAEIVTASSKSENVPVLVAVLPLVTVTDELVAAIVGGSSKKEVRLASVAFHAAATERRAMQARASDLDTFLGAVNRAESDGRFEYDRERATIFYSTVVSLTGEPFDDVRLGRAIALTVSAVRAIGPIVRDLVRGQLSLQQALDILNRAVAESERERRRRSA